MRKIALLEASVRLGRVQALDAVSLGLEAGRAKMLIGPNGAGKTTLLKILLGLVRPDAGRLEVDGRPARVDNAWKQGLGYLPESVAFSENLSGRQVLQFFARARGTPRERIDPLLERVGLERAGRRAVRGYSRGMRQRLGLAVAILSTPPLLILDEPTAGLDQEGLDVLWDVLQEWRREQRMVLVSTHDLTLMERRVDDIDVLRAGRRLAGGTPDELRRSAELAHRVWLELDQQEEPRAALLQAAMEKWGKGVVTRSGDRLVVDVFPDALLELMTIQAGFPGVARSIRVEEPSLEAVYGQLLGAA